MNSDDIDDPVAMGLDRDDRHIAGGDEAHETQASLEFMELEHGESPIRRVIDRFGSHRTESHRCYGRRVTLWVIPACSTG